MLPWAPLTRTLVAGTAIWLDTSLIAQDGSKSSACQARTYDGGPGVAWIDRVPNVLRAGALQGHLLSPLQSGIAGEALCQTAAHGRPQRCPWECDFVDDHRAPGSDLQDQGNATERLEHDGPPL